MIATRSAHTSRNILAALTLAAATLPALGATPANNPAPAKARIAHNYGNLPLTFEANQGQSDPQVKFLARGNGYSLFLTNRAAVLSLTKLDSGPNSSGICHPERSEGPASPARAGTASCASASRKGHDFSRADKAPRTNRAFAPARTSTDTIAMQLANANPNPEIEGSSQLPGTANYFLGNDPAKWRTNVPTYAKVQYKNVYNGIDLVYYGNQRQLEYDFIVQPGHDPKSIQLHFAGAQKLKLAPNGDLEILAQNGQIAFHKPTLYQEKDGQRQPIQGQFKLLAENKIGFQIGAYDPSRALVIDPVLVYSTYLGGTGSDYAASIAVDPAGSAYLTGFTYSSQFPTTTGAYQANSNYTANTDVSAVFVAKLNAGATALAYSTYLSGTTEHCTSGTNYNALTQGDFGAAIAVDASGNAYVTGGSCADDFPTTPGAFQTAPTGGDHHANNCFIAKLNSTGSKLTYSTYLGGQGNHYSGDWCNSIAIDASGNAYVTGQTSSPNFPTTPGAFQTAYLNLYGKDNAFVTKMNATGSALIYSTYLGGSGVQTGETPGDSGNGIVISASGNAYIAGYTYSSDFPTTKGAYQTVNKAYAITGSSPFVTELSPTGASLVFSTFLGGSTQLTNLQDSANGIALDSAGNVYIAGATASSNFPITAGAYQTKFNGGTLSNAFVSKLNPTGTALLYSTFLGGSGNPKGPVGDGAQAISIDPLGDVYLTGYTGSSDFPVTVGAYQTANKAFANNAQTAFVTQLNPAGSALLYSTYFGGAGVTENVSGDIGNAIAFSNGAVYFAGATESSNFPVTSAAFQKSLTATAGNSNAFLAKLEVATATATTLVADGDPEPAGAKVVFTADVTAQAASGTPTGTMVFSIDSAAVATVALDDTGHAAYSTTTLAEGVHSVVASYLGDATHLASTSATLSQSIYGAATAIAVSTGSAQTAVYGSAYAIPLAAVVKDAKGDLIPGATVTFSGTGFKFSSATAVTAANGIASVTATPTAVGTLAAKATVTGLATPATFTETATKAVLTVAATGISLKYGAPIPTLGYTVTGFVDGDTAAVVTGKPTETTTATATSQPGVYPIALAAGTLAATNYSFKLVDGTVTITSLGVTAEPAGTETVTIAEATSGATVYYTTNGTTPTTASTVYKGPIAVTATTTIKFIAVAPGYTPSPVRTIVVEVE